MPLYEYRCRECESVFELRRPMAEAGLPAACPDGHPNAVKLLSVFAATGRSSVTVGASAAPSGGSAGSCGSGCGCH